MALQETHQRMNTKENRKTCTWYFGGSNDEKTIERESAGVAFVIRNDWKQYVEDTRSYGERIMTLTLAAQPNITIINAYAPPATPEHYENKSSETFYNNLELTTKKSNKNLS